MNQLPQAINSDAKTQSSENQNSEVVSDNSGGQTLDSENVDSNTLAAVLQFLQKHNLKVRRRFFFSNLEPFYNC